MENFYFKNEYNILSKINGPKDLKNLSNLELVALCKEIRSKIVSVVSKNGGHLASNLGAVELTVAIHKEFNSPQDTIIWDTGHQAYAHKLLTGRFKKFNSLRKKDGIFAFTNPKESPHDGFIAGHSSISLSAACGIAKAKMLNGINSKVVVVVGDGALTGGMVYEALNNALDLNNLIIIFNCNDMSISKTVGSFSKYITNIRANKAYVSMSNFLKEFLEKIPLIGTSAKNILDSSKEKIKKMVYKSNFFSDLGYSFLNFVDGHSLKDLEKGLKWAKNTKKPAIIQVFSKKGKGFLKAEKNPEAYHAVGPFKIKEGVLKDKNSLSFSKVFGEELLKFAKKDKRICAITAAMGNATGLYPFKENFEKRYFDVGIAEEHATTFAAGLAIKGMIPVFAIYSTFLQRAYDQLIHDVAILNLHVILAIDRAGVVEDGQTHQGVFDVCFLTTIPNVKVYAPATYEELKVMLKKAIYEEEGLVAVRYSKFSEIKNFNLKKEENFVILGDSKIAVLSYGILFEEALKAQKILKEKGVEVALIKLNKIFPIENELINILKNYKEIFFFEESIKNGSIGEHLGLKLLENGFSKTFNLTAIDGVFVKQCTKEQAWQSLNLNADAIVKTIFKKSFLFKNIKI